MSQTVDVVLELSKLMVRTLRALGNADAQQRERACEFAGEAWALLHEQHPEAAERMNGVLHYLTGPRFNKPGAEGATAAEGAVHGDSSPAVATPVDANPTSTAAAASVAAVVGVPIEMMNMGSDTTPEARHTESDEDEAAQTDHPWLPAPESLQTEAEVMAYYEDVGEKAASGRDFDMEVRHLIPADRHTLIIDAFNKLSPKQGFVLVNDHDPKPLYYQFAFEYADRFTWDPIEEGPEVWRVRIGRR